jgi:hypothetical protein
VWRGRASQRDTTLLGDHDDTVKLVNVSDLEYESDRVPLNVLFHRLNLQFL